MADLGKEALYRREKEELAEKIYKALNDLERSYREDIVLHMKSGSTVTIKHHYVPARRVMGRWHSHTYYYEVISIATDEVRYFRTLYRLSKAMAYGFIK